jgi:glyoxalase family protein
MQLEGLHHITMITGQAQRNVDFYADLLGLRLVKKTVNFDAPEAYHLYFGDERGTPGSILTWFEFPGARRGRAGAGMIHTIELGVGSPEALDFWAQRLRSAGYDAQRSDDVLGFDDYDGLHLELVLAGDGESPLAAHHPQIPFEHAIVGVRGARAFAAQTEIEELLLTDTLGFTSLGAGAYRLDGAQRRFRWSYDSPPRAVGIQGAGTVHHIAWGSADADHLTWQQRVRDAGGHVTNVRDRGYFQSIYFRQTRGILFEIATLSPGFAVDENPDHLGEELKLPRMHEHLRAQLERQLAPVLNPRAAARERVGR